MVFFSLRALPVPHVNSSGSSQRSRRASCIPVRPSCCPCFHSSVCPWLRLDDHFPNCAKKWCLKIDVNLSQHSDLNLWSLISDLPREKFPRGKCAPGKVLALGRGHMPGGGAQSAARGRLVGIPHQPSGRFHAGLSPLLPAGLSAEPPCRRRAVPSGELRQESP